MKRQEWILISLPCVLLAGIALFSRAREQAQATKNAPLPSSPFRLVVKNIAKIAPDASDVAAGYDSKVRVLIGYSGKTSPGWGSKSGFFSDTRVQIQRGGKSVRLMDNAIKNFQGHGIPVEFNGFQSEANAYQFAFPLRLREVPASYGELTLQSDWFYSASGPTFSSVGPDKFDSLRRFKAPHAVATIVVRGKGESISQPRISRNPQIQVRRVVVRPLTRAELSEYSGADTKVEFHVFYDGPLDKAKIIAHSAGENYLQDQYGKKHIYNILTTSDRFTENKLRNSVVPYYFNLARAPLKGRVTFHTQLQAADNWPLDVQAEVRPR